MGIKEEVDMAVNKGEYEEILLCKYITKKEIENIVKRDERIGAIIKVPFPVLGDSYVFIRLKDEGLQNRARAELLETVNMKGV